MEITGILTEWHMLPDRRIYAKIVVDYKKRFQKGMFMTTSEIREIQFTGIYSKGVRFARTKNSIYILV